MRDTPVPLGPSAAGRQVVDASMLDGLDLEEHLRDPARRQAFVTPMFDVIADRYDEFTRRFSFGMDARWKRDLVSLAVGGLPAAGGGDVLDVACGTGDLAIAIARARPSARVAGVDASARMIARAIERSRGGRVVPRFAVGDLMRLELPDASIDVVTAGYALRNVPDWGAGIRELSRVLRPGGRLVTLDFYRPESAAWRALFLAYLQIAGNLVGWRWHGRAVVYGYIARSIRAFATARELAAVLRRSGFVEVRVRTFLSGGVAIHEATRG